MASPKPTAKLSARLEQLAALHGLTHNDGSINYNAFARRVGLPAPTIMRWHKASTKDVSKKTIHAVCRALNVSEAQVRGIEPLFQGGREGGGKKRADRRDIQLISQLRSLPLRKQRDIEKFLDLRISMVMGSVE